MNVAEVDDIEPVGTRELLNVLGWLTEELEVLSDKGLALNEIAVPVVLGPTVETVKLENESVP